MKSFVKLLAITFLCFSCGGGNEEEDAVPTNCTEAYCPFVGVWILNQLSADGSPVNENLSSYRLDLKKPGSDSQAGNYQRTFANGENETGTWSVGNNGSVILLNAPDGTETYIVESVAASSLVLVFERESAKPGPELFRFAFKK